MLLRAPPKDWKKGTVEVFGGVAKQGLISVKKWKRAQRMATKDWKSFLQRVHSIKDMDVHHRTKRYVFKLKNKVWGRGFLSPHQVWHNHDPPAGWRIFFIEIDKLNFHPAIKDWRGNELNIKASEGIIRFPLELNTVSTDVNLKKRRFELDDTMITGKGYYTSRSDVGTAEYAAFYSDVIYNQVDTGDDHDEQIESSDPRLPRKKKQKITSASLANKDNVIIKKNAKPDEKETTGLKISWPLRVIDPIDKSIKLERVDDIVDWVKPKFMPYGKCTVLGGEANWHSAQAILHRKAVNHENPEQSFVITKFMKYKLPRVTGIHAVAGIYFSTASNNRRLSVPFADPESATFTVERKLIRNFSSEPSGYVDIDHARKILHNVSQPWTKQLIDGVDPRKAFTVKDKPKVATKETKKNPRKARKCIDVPESEEKKIDDPGEAKHEETKTMVNSELCSVCCKRGLLILCDGCPQAYHAGCINMKMEDVPDEFFCRDHNMKCIKRKSATELEKKLTAKMIAKQKKKVFIPQHTPSHLYITN